MADNPVKGRGKVEIATMGEIRRYTAGRAIVLSGRLGYRVVGPNEPIDLIALVTEGYKTFFDLDTTAKHAVRRESCRMADPRYSFDMIVKVSARVADPATYLRVMGPDASIFDAFYQEVTGALSMACSQFAPPELNEAQAELRALSEDIKRTRPFYNGVEIIQFDVALEYGQELKRFIETLDRMANVRKFGEEILVFEAGGDAQKLEQNSKVIQQLDQIQTNRRAQKHAEVNQALDVGKRLVTEFGEEPRKLLDQANVREALGRIIELPAKRDEPGVLRLVSGTPPEES